MWKLRIPGPCRPSISLSAAEEQVEPLAVVVAAEVVEPGLVARLLVQDLGVERGVGGHHRHEAADLLDVRSELRHLEIVDDNWFCHGCTLSVTVVT